MANINLRDSGKEGIYDGRKISYTDGEVELGYKKGRRKAGYQ